TICGWRRRSRTPAPRGARAFPESTVAAGGIAPDGDHDAAAADLVDDGARDLGRQRRTAEAAPEAAVLPSKRLRGVGRGVKDDVPRARPIVDALVEPVDAQRIAVCAEVGFGGAEDTEAGAVALRLVPEPARDEIARPSTVGYPLG